MKWTKNKPTKEGYYWFRPSKKEESVIVEVFPEHIGGSVKYCNHPTWGECIPLVTMGGWWSDESIKEPKEEK